MRGIWQVYREFPKIRGTLFWGPYDKENNYLGYYIRVPFFGNSHMPMLSGLDCLVLSREPHTNTSYLCTTQDAQYGLRFLIP